ncbi:alanine racemase [bacterium]|jgi:alanine racemase|nr:alanine racemase [bacterium]
MSRTKYIVDLKQYGNNIKNIRESLNPTTKILLTLKCDAYGLGAVKLAEVAEKQNVAYFGVASIEEALELREAGIETNILLFSEPFLDDLKKIVTLNITPTLFKPSSAYLLNEISKKKGIITNFHFKLDTGMARNGTNPEQAYTDIQYILNLPYLKLESIYTHISDGSKPYSSYTHNQNRQFVKFIQKVKLLSKNSYTIHIANSDTTLNFPQYQYDMVRIGLHSYRHIMTLMSKVLLLKLMDLGDFIGYERSYTLKRKAIIAIIAIGYGDGIPYQLSNKGTVLINGIEYPIVGKVCMDHIMVNLGPNSGKVSEGDDVVIIGKQKQQQISLEKVARISGNIPYSIMTGISKRVPREYVSN